jgi:ankyrin repeat protein
MFSPPAEEQILESAATEILLSNEQNLSLLRSYHQLLAFDQIAAMLGQLGVLEFIKVLDGLYPIHKDDPAKNINGLITKRLLVGNKEFLEKLGSQNSWLMGFYLDYFAKRGLLKHSYCLLRLLVELEYDELLRKTLGSLHETEKHNALKIEMDDHSDTLLHFAVRNGNKKMVRVILELCETDDLKRTVLSQKHGDNPLHIAALNDDFETAEIIGEFCLTESCKEYLSRRNQNGAYTPFEVAVCKGHPKTAQVVFEKCMPSSSKESISDPNDRGDTLLHLAASSGFIETLAMVLQFFSSGDHINRALRANNKGTTPLHFAAASGNAEIIRRVSQLYASNEQRLWALEPDDEGNTPLHIAVSKGFEEAAREIGGLLTTTACQDKARSQNNAGNTLIHLSVQSGSISVVQMLLGFYTPDQWKVYAYLSNNERDTVLHLAARNCPINMFESVLSQYSHADLVHETYKRNLKGESILHCAAFNKDPAVLCAVEKLFSIEHMLTPYLGTPMFGDLNPHGLTMLCDNEACRPEVRILAKSYVCMRTKRMDLFAAIWRSFLQRASDSVLFTQIILRDPVFREALRQSVIETITQRSQEINRQQSYPIETKFAFAFMTKQQDLHLTVKDLGSQVLNDWKKETIFISGFQGNVKAALSYMRQEWVPKINWNSQTLIRTPCPNMELLKKGLLIIPLHSLAALALDPESKMDLIHCLGGLNNNLLTFIMPLLGSDSLSSIFQHWQQTFYRLFFLSFASFDQKLHFMIQSEWDWIGLEADEWISKHIQLSAGLNSHQYAEIISSLLPQARELKFNLQKMLSIFSKQPFNPKKKEWSQKICDIDYLCEVFVKRSQAPLRR